MNKVKIPTKFQLLGQEIEVVFDDELYFKEAQNRLGLCDFDNNIIYIQPDSSIIPRPETQIEHTYLHELTHMILIAIGKNELASDESFVDMFAGLLLQILKTSEYKSVKRVSKK